MKIEFAGGFTLLELFPRAKGRAFLFKDEEGHVFLLQNNGEEFVEMMVINGPILYPLLRHNGFKVLEPNLRDGKFDNNVLKSYTIKDGSAAKEWIQRTLEDNPKILWSVLHTPRKRGSFTGVQYLAILTGRRQEAERTVYEHHTSRR